ncbi:hypothetical protein WJ0W_006554 [Paenibacillus melissococcoides]|uniref:Uncharacterized protein n=1 Tax=Paenibacillus melissococcoides TaxID=2912268 RepID=A0ABN8UE31_9BACL|nr:hypothetical protein [Paenibacillus melissococcoides]CAH8249368.1 hypothetical protein WJ0W_006554 [Paenibacillus melissococcoides]CAH8721250.1 hypothetical protein WDD9_006201 [Paenibacillus melissococcoides]CAH8721582.1 hypothetical protein HTL2_006431 [Paenibacillus melissococcoides]
MDDRITKNVHRELRTMNGKLDEIGSVFRIMTDSILEQIAEMKRAARPKRGGPALATGGIASDVKSIANMMRRQASIRPAGQSLAHAAQPNAMGQQLSASLSALQSTTVVVQVPAKAEDKKSGNEEKSYWQKALEFAKTAQDYVYAASDSITKVKDAIENVEFVKKLFSGESGSQCKCCCCQGGGSASSGLAGGGRGKKKKVGRGKPLKLKRGAPGRSGGEGAQRQKELGNAVAPSKSGAAAPPGKGGTALPAAKGAPAASPAKSAPGASPAKSGPATPPSAGGTAAAPLATAASSASAPQGKSASASTPFVRGRRKVTNPKPKRGLLKKVGSWGAVAAMAGDFALNMFGRKKEEEAEGGTDVAIAAAQTTAETVQSVQAATGTMADIATSTSTASDVGKAASAAKKTGWFGKLLKGARTVSKATRFLRFTPAGFLGGLALDAGLWAAEKFLLPKEEEQPAAAPDVKKLSVQSQISATTVAAGTYRPMAEAPLASAPPSPLPEPVHSGSRGSFGPPLPAGNRSSFDVTANSNVVMNLNVNGYIDMRMIEEIKRIAREQFDASFRSFERSIASKLPPPKPMPKPVVAEGGMMSY